MICEKCGKSNISSLSECMYCGAKMPAATGCGGFSDILSYTDGGVIQAPLQRNENNEGISESDMEKLTNKSDKIIKSVRINSLFGLIIIGLSIITLITSIIFGCVTLHTVNVYKKMYEETASQIEVVKKDLSELKSADQKTNTKEEKAPLASETNAKGN